MLRCTNISAQVHKHKGSGAQTQKLRCTNRKAQVHKHKSSGAQTQKLMCTNVKAQVHKRKSSCAQTQKLRCTYTKAHAFAAPSRPPPSSTLPQQHRPTTGCPPRHTAASPSNTDQLQVVLPGIQQPLLATLTNDRLSTQAYSSLF